MEVWRVPIYHLAPHSQPPYQCPEPDSDTDSQSPLTDMSVSPKCPNPSFTLEFTPTSCLGLGKHPVTHMMNHTQRCLSSKDSSSEHAQQEAISIQEGLLRIWKESLPDPPEPQGKSPCPSQKSGVSWWCVHVLSLGGCFLPTPSVSLLSPGLECWKS